MNTDNANSSSLFSIRVDRGSSVATDVLDFFIGLLERRWPAPGGSTWRRTHAGLRFRLASGLQAKIASLLETLMG
jgi:hypothetical protein